MPVSALDQGIVPDGFVGASWCEFPLWGWKSSQLASWGLPGASFGSGAGNRCRWLPGGLLGPITALELEIVPDGFLGASWEQFRSCSRKSSQMASWKPPGASFCPGAGNRPRRLPGSFLGPVSALDPEIVPDGFMGASWGQFRPWGLKSSQMVSWAPLGLVSALGLEIVPNGFLVASWGQIASWGWKSFSMASWGLPGASFGPGAGNRARLLLGNFLEPVSALGLEIVPDGFLGASWSQFRP